MVGTNASTNERHKLYNSTVQAISRGVGDCVKKVGALCDRFVDMRALIKNQVDNGLRKLFDFWGHTIDMSDQSVFILKYSVHNDDERNKTNVSNPLTSSQRSSGRVLSFMMTVHPYQAGPNCNYSCITFRDCIQIPLDIDGIYASIDTQILKTHIILVHLEALDNGRNPDIGTLKKDKGEIFQNAAPKALRKFFYVM